MKRREFIALVGGVVAWPLSVSAQSMRRVGVLMNLSEADEESRLYTSTFLDALQKAGWTEGRNIRVDIRWGAASAERYAKFAAELVALSPDVILAANSSIVRALQKVTHTVPIVFAGGTDPVVGGVVASLARPGGNVTGFSSFEFGMSSKWIELLKQLSPRIARIAVLYNPNAIASVGQLHALQAAAPSFQVELTGVDTRSDTEIDKGLAAVAAKPHGAIIGTSNAAVSEHRDHIIALAGRFHLPASYPFRYFVRSGGLISYGPDRVDPYRRAAGYVDRILRGAKPADLPVQEPTKYELAVNVKTAKELGLEIPATLLGLADEVIE
jgi:putative ABC transport system substrate-binding protein